MSNPPNIVFEEVSLNLGPAEAYARMRVPGRPSFLLESAEGSSRTVAYSFLGTCPVTVLRGRDGQDLREVREIMRSRPTNKAPFPFMGGLVGYFSYHFVNSMEKDLHLRDEGFPAYELGLYSSGLVYDHSAFKVYHFHPEGEEARPPLLNEEVEAEPFHLRERLSETG
ncbi:MAG TPA: hypothetical protein PKJ15_01770, partial [Methanomassiliicoccales archaeon]|nr:hypothetical protein [Methanomassiliicoccales archaeon]